MRFLSAFLLLPLLAACATSSAPVAVRGEVIQKGIFREESCKTDIVFADSAFDFCLCRADLTAAQTGDAQLDERLRVTVIERMCHGEPLRSAEKYGDDELSRFTVTRNDSRWLSIVYDHYHYPAGAAHGGTVSEPHLYDRKAGRWVEQGELPPKARRAEVAAVLKAELERRNQKEYGGDLWLGEYDLAKTFTDKGCYGCVVYPSAGGKWTVRFLQYSIGPYAIGMVDVELDRKYFER